MRDVFVYKDQFVTDGIPLQDIRKAEEGCGWVFQFNVAKYYGKYKKSRKAINIRLMALSELTRTELDELRMHQR